MILKAILAATILALPLQASSVAVLPQNCPEGQGPCGDGCIPLNRTCCKLLASRGTAHGPCPREWGCTSSGECNPLGLPGENPRNRPVAPNCPEGMAACGSKCIAAEDVCCSNGLSCPAGLVCAPPPLQCAEPAETQSVAEEAEEPTPAPEPVSSRERTLQMPGDLELPTTAPDYTLPTPEHTTPPGEESSKGECSAPRTTVEQEADDELDSHTKPESSFFSGPITASTEDASAEETTAVVTVDPSEGPTEDQHPTETETETEAPEESQPAEEDGGHRAESTAWKWVAPAVAALLFV